MGEKNVVHEAYKLELITYFVTLSIYLTLRVVVNTYDEFQFMRDLHRLYLICFQDGIEMGEWEPRKFFLDEIQ